MHGETSVIEYCNLCAVCFFRLERGGGMMHLAEWEDVPVIDPSQRPIALFDCPVNFS